MKHTKILYALLLGLVFGAAAGISQHATKVYFDYGGDKLVVASGGELEVQSGGTVDMQSGATIGASAATVTTLTATTGAITTISGTSSTLSYSKLTGASAPPVACAAGTAGTSYFDSDIAKTCICNGTNYVLANDDTTTTGCS